MTFNVALSGLNAASTDLNVTGNNIANVGTTGFKASRAEFADLYATSMLGSENAVGSGVTTADIAQQFTQGISQTLEIALIWRSVAMVISWSVTMALCFILAQAHSRRMTKATS